MLSNFQKNFTNTPLDAFSNKKVEDRKISYWLEMLFNQEEARKANEEIETNTSQQSKSQLSDSKLEPKMQIFGKTSTDKGTEEAIEDHSRKEENDKTTLEDMVNNSNRILISISSVFPWDIFPTTINVEGTRLTIIHRQLFSSQVHSVDIKNISNIFIDMGIVFAQLTVVSSTFVSNEIKINRLRKREAIQLRRIIEGLRMFVEKNIDTANYSVDELVNKLKELSTTTIVV